MIDFEEKRGQGEFQFWNTSDDITDLLTTQYDEPTGAMRQLTQHLLPAVPIVSAAPAPPVKAESALPPVDTATTPATPSDQIIAEIPHQTVSSAMTPLDSTDDGEGDETLGQISTPKPKVEQEQQFTYDWSNVDFDIVEEASKAPLDGAIAAAIAMAGTENKVKAASMSILLIGGTSALKGLGAFVSERYVLTYSQHVTTYMCKCLCLCVKTASAASRKRDPDRSRIDRPAPTRTESAFRQLEGRVRHLQSRDIRRGHVDQAG